MKKLIFLFCALCAGQLFAQQAGSLDGDFDGDGLVSLYDDIFGIYNLEGRACAIQADGKILFIGNAVYSPQEYYLLRRLNPDGSVDPDHNVYTAYFHSSIESGRVKDIVVSPNGSSIIGCTVTDTLGFSSFALHSWEIAGHRTNGFGNSGEVILNWQFSSPAGLEALALQTDGKVVAVGYETELNKTHFAIARLNTDGTLDNSFSFDGLATATMGISDFAQDVLIQPDGKILVAGSAHNGQGHAFAFIRFNTNGTLDNSFGNAGKAVFSFPNTEEAFLSSIQLQSDGKIVAGGFVYEGNECDVCRAWHYTNR